MQTDPAPNAARQVAGNTETVLLTGSPPATYAALIAEIEALRAERDGLREALRDIERRCSEHQRLSPNANLVGKTPAAKKAGTIRNCANIARAALAGEQP